MKKLAHSLEKPVISSLWPGVDSVQSRMSQSIGKSSRNFRRISSQDDIGRDTSSQAKQRWCSSFALLELRLAAPCVNWFIAGWWNGSLGSGSYVRQARATNGGLLFGLLITDLGNTEIFEPICRGIAGAPRAAPHALLWGSAAPNHVSAEAQALELSEQFLLRVPHIAFCQQTESLGETLYPRFLGASGS